MATDTRRITRETRKKIMSKTPFELRAELLQMSKDLLEKQYEANVKAFTSWTDLLVNSTKLNTELLNDIQEKVKNVPKFPTMEEIISYAEKFKGFVGGKE